MKKKVLIGMFSWALSLQAGLETREIALWDMSELQKLTKGDLPDSVVHFPKGWKVPVELFYSGDFFDLVAPSNQPPYRVEVQRDFFMRMLDAQTVLFSLDGVEWKPFDEMTRGSFGFHLKQSEDRGPVISIGGHLEERDLVR